MWLSCEGSLSCIVPYDMFVDGICVCNSQPLLCSTHVFIVTSNKTTLKIMLLTFHFTIARACIKKWCINEILYQITSLDVCQSKSDQVYSEESYTLSISFHIWNPYNSVSIIGELCDIYIFPFPSFYVCLTNISILPLMWYFFVTNKWKHV